MALARLEGAIAISRFLARPIRESAVFWSD
jgi:hypothetical protein